MVHPTPESTSAASPHASDARARRPRRWRGALIALAGMALLAGGAWYLVHRPAAEGGGWGGGMGRGPGGGGGGSGGPPITVGQAVARKASVPVTLDALGTVTPVATVTVRPQVAGVMTEVLFTEGQMVRKGEVLARIDPRSFEQALMQAQGARVRDEAQLEAARVTLARYRTLLEQDSIARQDVDTQAALVKQLEGTVTTDRASEAGARLNLDYTRVTAPVAGRVGLRAVDVGNYIAAGATTGIAVITQVAPIDVVFALPQDRVPEIQSRIAQGASLAVAAFDRTRTRKLADGVFSTLDNLVDVQTGTVKAKARFVNADGALFPSQFVNVQLVLRTIDDALVVPVTALRTSGDGNYVYVIDDAAAGAPRAGESPPAHPGRTVSMRNVVRGEATAENVVIAQGLKEGERVVTEGGDRLKDGSAVQLPGDVPARAGANGGHSPGGAPGAQRHRRHPADSQPPPAPSPQQPAPQQPPAPARP